MQNARDLNAEIVHNNIWKFFKRIRENLQSKSPRYTGGVNFTRKFKRGGWKWFIGEIDGKLDEFEKSEKPEELLARLGGMLALCYLTICPNLEDVIIEGKDNMVEKTAQRYQELFDNNPAIQASLKAGCKSGGCKI